MPCFKRVPYISQAFRRRIVDNKTTLRNFWAAMAETPIMAGNPLRERAGYEEWCVPLAMHGDGTPVTGMGKTWCKMVDIYSWSSLLGVGSTIETNFYIWSVFQRSISTLFNRCTMSRFWKILSWSFYHLYIGEWPRADPDGRVYTAGVLARLAGTSLAGGYCGVLWVVKGDLDYLFKNLKLPNYMSANPCAFCTCTNDDANVPWKDLRVTADWFANQWSTHAWRIAHPGCIRLFLLPWMSIWSVHADYMHCKFLGTDQYFYGSVLSELCFRVLVAASPQAALHDLVNRLKAYWRDYGVSGGFSGMKLSMFHKVGRYPKLRGKAAEIKRLGPALLHVWSEVMDVGPMVGHGVVAERRRYHRRVKMALSYSVAMDDIIDEHRLDYKLPLASAQRLEDSAFAFFALQAQLQRDATQQGLRLYDITIKNHYLAHIVVRAKDLNPRFAWCFSGEDLMKHIKIVLHSCCKGNKTYDATAKFVLKYRHGQHMVLTSPALAGSLVAHDEGVA